MEEIVYIYYIVQNSNSHILINKINVISVCTMDSWNTLQIENSIVPNNLPVRYLTAVTIQCVEGYITNSVVKCHTNGEFIYTGRKPTCKPGM